MRKIDKIHYKVISCNVYFKFSSINLNSNIATCYIKNNLKFLERKSNEKID